MNDQTLRECIKALLEIESGLTDWEVGFVEDMSEQRMFTEPMANEIIKIYDENC